MSAEVLCYLVNMLPESDKLVVVAVAKSQHILEGYVVSRQQQSLLNCQPEPQFG